MIVERRCGRPRLTTRYPRNPGLNFKYIGLRACLRRRTRLRSNQPDQTLDARQGLLPSNNSPRRTGNAHRKLERPCGRESRPLSGLWFSPNAHRWKFMRDRFLPAVAVLFYRCLDPPYPFRTPIRIVLMYVCTARSCLVINQCELIVDDLLRNSCRTPERLHIPPLLLPS